MFEFISLQNIIDSLIKAGINIDVLLLDSFQKSVIYIGGNILYVIILVLIISIAYKLILKILNFVL